MYSVDRADPQRLIVRCTPWFSRAFGTAGLLAAGAVLWLVFPTQVRLHCERAALEPSAELVAQCR